LGISNPVGNLEAGIVESEIVESGIWNFESEFVPMTILAAQDSRVNVMHFAVPKE